MFMGKGGLGAVLYKGLTEDLMDVRKPYKRSLRTALAYMIVYRYLDEPSAELILDILREGKTRGVYDEDDFKAIFTVIVMNLEEKKEFSNSAELFRVLDETEIPFWIRYAIDPILDHFPNVALIGHDLFFINSNGNSVCLDVNKIISYDSVLKPPAEEVISNTYNRIAGYDDDGYVYLTSDNFPYMYGRYNIKLKEESVFFPYMLLGLMNEGRDPVMVSNNRIYMIRGNKVTLLHDYHSYMSYEVYDDHIEISPKEGAPCFFKPYRIMSDGKREEFSQDEYREFILDTLLMYINVNDTYVIMAKAPFMDKEGKVKVTIKKVADLLEKDEIEWENKEDIKLILGLLEKHCDRDEDISEFLGVLFELTSKVNVFDELLIPQTLIDRLIEMDRKGELKDLIGDPGALKERLLIGAECVDEKLEEYRGRSDRFENVKVGDFELKDGKLLARTVMIMKASLVGNILMKENKEKKGCVTYDISKGEFVIQYNRALNSNELKAVISSFNLSDSRYKTVIV